MELQVHRHNPSQPLTKAGAGFSAVAMRYALQSTVLSPRSILPCPFHPCTYDITYGRCRDRLSNDQEAVFASPTFLVFVGRGNPGKTQSIIPYATGVLDCRTRKSGSFAMTDARSLFIFPPGTFRVVGYSQSVVAFCQTTLL